MGDLPDYTKYIAAAPTPSPVATLMGTKAETVTHKSATDTGTTNLTVTLPAPADGYKIGLIIVVGTTNLDGSHLEIETLQSSLWAKVLEPLDVGIRGPLNLVFPCWIPDQDVGDGSTQTVRINMGGQCGAGLAAFILYFEEEA